MLDVQLIARPADHRAVDESRADAEVFGQAGRVPAGRDAVDVGERQPGIGQGLLDHRDFEGATVLAELAGGRCRVRDPHDRRLSSQRARCHAVPLRSPAGPEANPLRCGRVLSTPLQVGGTRIRNRLYRAPVLEGAGDGDDAAEVYSRHFVENARHGLGLIIQGSSCITPEGRTSPGMTCVDTREKMLRLAPMVDAVHAEGTSIFIQLGHGGLFAMEAWHEPYTSQRAGPLLAASRPPVLLRPALRGIPVHVLTTDEVHTLADQYGEVAAWAREAGYDGVQLGSANAKLLDQFLSPFYNHRTDEFGGSAEKPRVDSSAHPERGRRARGRRVSLQREGPGRDGSARVPAHEGQGRARVEPPGRGVGL